MLAKATKEANKTTRALQTAARATSRLGRVYMHASVWKDDYGPASRSGTAVVTFDDDSGVKRTVEVPCRIAAGYTDAIETRGVGSQAYVSYTDSYAPTSGYESLSRDLFTSAVLSLPSHAEVRLDVILDGGNNELCVEASLHADRVYLVAHWTERNARVERKFLIEACMSKHNSARFGVSK